MTSGSVTLRRSVIFVLSVVIAAAVHLLYGAIEFFSRQIFGDQAEDEYMVRLASIFGIQRKVADFASGPFVFTGVNGSLISSGQRLQRSDGVFFQTTENGTITGGTATIDIEAEEAGTGGNTEEGVEMTLVSPIAGVASKGTVGTGGIANGVDEETIDELRARYLERVRNTPQGGSERDYERWAKEVPGVTRAWAYGQHMGPGTVGLTFVMDNETDIIPDSSKVADVQSYIDEVRPVTDALTVFAPTPVDLDFEIELIDQDTAAIRAAIEAELRDLLNRESEPGGTIRISHIREAISIAAGEVDHDLQVPAGDVSAGTGELLVMGSITWV